MSILEDKNFVICVSTLIVLDKDGRIDIMLFTNCGIEQIALLSITYLSIAPSLVSSISRNSRIVDDQDDFNTIAIVRKCRRTKDMKK